MDVRLKYRYLRDFISNHAELQVQEMTSIVREINEAGLTDQGTLTEQNAEESDVNSVWPG